MAMAAGSGNAAAVSEAVRQSEQMLQAGVSEAMREEPEVRVRRCLLCIYMPAIDRSLE